MIITGTEREIIELSLTKLFRIEHQFNVGDNVIVKAQFRVRDKELPKDWNKILDKYIYEVI